VDDRQLWDQGLQGIKRLLAGLPQVKMRQLTELLTDYRREKEALADVLLRINSEITCRACAGQCCLNGKYRINVLDLLSLCAEDRSLMPNFEQKPLCPYGTVSGCLMETRFRPADCILFICDDIDVHLSGSARSSLAAMESSLRNLLDDASRLLGVPIATPLLLWSEKFQPIHTVKRQLNGYDQ